MADKKYKCTELIEKFNEYRAFKQKKIQEWRLIRSIYKGDFWNIFKKYMKDYTITPDCNYFEYVVQAYLNSIYSGAFIGTITPRRVEDEPSIRQLNAFINYQWNLWGMKNKYLHVGENGELYNLGAVRVEWSDRKKRIFLKAVAPQELYFDPSVDNYREGEAIFVERSVNINTLKNKKEFKDEVEKYLKDKTIASDKTTANRLAGYENQASSKNTRVSLIECFIRNDEDTIDQVFILDEAVIISEKLNLPLKNFPIVCYTPQRPDGDPYGSSKLLKILNTSIALNLLDSMEATYPFRLLNRVRFVNLDGRINMRSFADFGNTPGASFEVRGDPRNIVYYQDIPHLPDLSNIKARLENTIYQVTGVDPYYRGRATNSVQTTGATQALQARVTMLTDNARITMLEEFTEDITRLIIEYYFNYGGDEVYEVPQLSATGTNQVVGVHRLNFKKMLDSKVTFDYHIAASTLLPMNQANLFESAKGLYEMQGQYQFKKQIITEEELIRYSDFPQKDLWLQRLARDDNERIASTLVADLTNFASIFSRLLAEGLSEEQAAQNAIQILIEEKNSMKQDPSLGMGLE
ncbi:MAG: hypothetical protein GX568_08435 [Candidatus Gastranaerophilales bacterium]|nr:hypothetical protein [Candidatus Gastranaerophilales bacterium]